MSAANPICLSSSAGVTVSQSDGAEEVSQDTVPGCCLCEQVASGESRQLQRRSVSLGLSLLSPWAAFVLLEHLFLVAGGESTVCIKASSAPAVKV